MSRSAILTVTILVAVTISAGITSGARHAGAPRTVHARAQLIPDAQPAPVTSVLAPSAVAVATPVRHSHRNPKSYAAAGYVVYRDPITGDFGPPPANNVPMNDQSRAAVNTSAVGLTEVQSPVHNGGTMVDLQGRFMNSMVATQDAHGHVTTTCSEQTAPAPAQGKE